MTPTFFQAGLNLNRRRANVFENLGLSICSPSYFFRHRLVIATTSLGELLMDLVFTNDGIFSPFTPNKANSRNKTG
jgi:hypothetical protein